MPLTDWRGLTNHVTTGNTVTLNSGSGPWHWPTVGTLDTVQNSIWCSWNNATTTGLTITIQASATKIREIDGHFGSASFWVPTYDTASVNVWTNWHNQFVQQAAFVRPELSAEQNAAFLKHQEELRKHSEAQHQVWLQKQREREEAEQRAKNRADALLKSALDKLQIEELETKGHFHVRTPTGRLFRIKKGSHGNVELLDATGKPAVRYCIQPDGVPSGDAMLAQKLHLEHNERAFDAIANKTDLATGRVAYGRALA